ncbi:MCM DNA helicase complex subunit, partial [Kickxella alabastrina]
MSGGRSSSPMLDHDSDMDDFVQPTPRRPAFNPANVDDYNTLPETPAPFSPAPVPTGGRIRQSNRTMVEQVRSSSPNLNYSEAAMTPGGGIDFSSQAMGGLPAGYTDTLSSQLGGMSMDAHLHSQAQSSGRASGRRGDLGSRAAQALSSELGEIEAGTAPTEIRTIWGTIVHVREVMSTFKDFLLHFTAAHRPPAAGTLSAAEMGEPVYPQLLRRMHASEVFQLNLDAQNLLAYAPAQRLYRQLVNYPEEVVPIMDYVLTELFMEHFPDADMDLAQSDLKVRPYNLTATTNMRELNPSDIDKMVSVRGMLIRA